MRFWFLVLRFSMRVSDVTPYRRPENLRPFVPSWFFEKRETNSEKRL